MKAQVRIALVGDYNPQAADMQFPHRPHRHRAPAGVQQVSAGIADRFPNRQARLPFSPLDTCRCRKGGDLRRPIGMDQVHRPPLLQQPRISARILFLPPLIRYFNCASAPLMLCTY